MARPEEKAQAMLNKWVKMREQGDNYAEIQASKRRPYLASLCDNLHDAEKFRRQIIREISDGISKIQNPGLGDHALRDLNDAINKSLREKSHVSIIHSWWSVLSILFLLRFLKVSLIYM